jgi:hypothetical protein
VKLLFEITEVPKPFIGVHVTMVWTKCIPILLVIPDKECLVNMFLGLQIFIVL